MPVKKIVKRDLDFENVSEFLDKNSDFLLEYLRRNPDVVDKFVVTTVEAESLQEWQQAIRKREMGAQLKLAKVDYLKMKNKFLHNTANYINNSLVIRRSGTFSLDLHFQNKFDSSKHKIWLEFSIGPNPKPVGGTKLRLPLSDAALQKEKWGARIVSQDDEAKKMNVEVNIPADAIIGRYQLTVEIASDVGGEKKRERTTKPDVIVIFNPFSKDDDCFMENAEEREEYVLNDVGLIFVCTPSVYRARDWLFGQFEEGVLDVALKLLRTDENERPNPAKSLKKRASPAHCSRVLSSWINSCDNNGVLEGNWSGDYDGGVSPVSWKGSVKILLEWGKSEAPVKYGQCWVFSGVLTTVLRALGIPARSVTNFDSAHDTEFNAVIDRFVDEDGEVSDLVESGDSIWNFHVWNEAYFKRPDLTPGYDGWQAVDATPQEESGGLMQCGPSPVKAIKNGEVYVGYDTTFIFSEVNADVMYWSVDVDGEVTGLLRKNTRHVGKCISTKAPGKNLRLDVTDDYKYEEGTPQEREAFERAYVNVKRTDYHQNFVLEAEGAINIEMSNATDPVIGKTLNTNVKVGNTTDEHYDVVVTTAMHTLLNNEKKKALVKRIKREVAIPAGQAHEETIALTANEYWSQLVDENVIRLTTTVRVKQTDKLYVDVFDVLPETPECLKIECADQLLYDEDNELTLVITNELPFALTEGVFEIESSAVKHKEGIKASGPIAPGETVRCPYNVFTKRVGHTKLLAEFDCKEFKNLKTRKLVRIG